jgi:chromate transporter
MLQMLRTYPRTYPTLAIQIKKVKYLLYPIRGKMKRDCYESAKGNKTKALTVEAARPVPPTGVSIVEFFFLFSRIGLTSFGGGVSAWMHREFVETRAWLGESEFSAALAFARILPGANIVNLAVLVGHRLMGVAGAAAAVTGVLVGPSVVVIGLAFLARQFGGSIILDAALEGMAAAAAGLLIGTGLKSGGRIIRIGLTSGVAQAEGVGAITVLVAMFVLVGVLRLPTAPVVLCLAPCSWALAFFASKGTSTERRRDGR